MPDKKLPDPELQKMIDKSDKFITEYLNTRNDLACMDLQFTVRETIYALRDEVVRQSERIEELVELRSTVIDIYLDMKCSRQRDFPLKAWRETLDKFGLLENPNDDTD